MILNNTLVLQGIFRRYYNLLLLNLTKLLLRGYIEIKYFFNLKSIVFLPVCKVFHRFNRKLCDLYKLKTLPNCLVHISSRASKASVVISVNLAIILVLFKHCQIGRISHINCQTGKSHFGGFMKYFLITICTISQRKESSLVRFTHTHFRSKAKSRRAQPGNLNALKLGFYLKPGWSRHLPA